MRTATRGTQVFFSVTLTLAGLAVQAPTTSFVTEPVLGSANIVVGEFARMDALVDANLDGKMDAVGFWTNEKERAKGDLRFMANDGKGRMSSAIIMAGVEIPADNPRPDIVLGDWDGDGNLDFALDHRNGSFIVTASFTPSGTITSSVAADFNGDKLDDLAILTTKGS